MKTNSTDWSFSLWRKVQRKLAQKWDAEKKFFFLTFLIILKKFFLFFLQEIPPANSFPSELVMKRGFLMRLESRRPLSKFWQKRFCVLAKNKIYFYKNEVRSAISTKSNYIFFTLMLICRYLFPDFFKYNYFYFISNCFIRFSKNITNNNDNSLFFLKL
jgi:hypothetical protein